MSALRQPISDSRRGGGSGAESGPVFGERDGAIGAAVGKRQLGMREAAGRRRVEDRQPRAKWRAPRQREAGA